MFKIGTLLAASAATAAAYSPEALADEVTNLPGAEGLDFSFKQFSGYVKVNNTKNMHYWMVESMNDPANDPVAFWTNGVSIVHVFPVCDVCFRMGQLK